MKFWKTKNKQKESPAGEKAVTESREYIAESLESRILFSGAPIDAPDASVSEESATPDATTSGNSFSTIEEFGSGAIQSADAQGVSDEIILASFNNLTPSEIEDLANEVNNAALDENQADFLLNLEASRINVTVPEGASGYETEVDSAQLSGQSLDFGTTISFPLLPSEQLGIDLITDAPLEISDSATLERLAGESAPQSTVDVPLANLPITTDILSVIADAAGQHWINSGLTAEQIDALNEIEYHIVELEGAALGYAEGSNVYIDDDAAGMEWFIDETPQELGESGFTGIDLLSVLAHEQGHVLGLEDIYDTARSSDLLYGIFEEGERRFVADNQAKGAIAGSLEGKHYATLSISDETVVEGDTITFTATLDEEVPGGFTVDVDFADGTATGGDIDYAPVVNEDILEDDFSSSTLSTDNRIRKNHADASWYAGTNSDWEITAGQLSISPTTQGTEGEGAVSNIITPPSDSNLTQITISFDYVVGAGSTSYFHTLGLVERDPSNIANNEQLGNSGASGGTLQTQWEGEYFAVNLNDGSVPKNSVANAEVLTGSGTFEATFDVSDYQAGSSDGNSVDVDNLADFDLLLFAFANSVADTATGAISIDNFRVEATGTGSPTLTFAGDAGENQTFTVTTNDDSILETTESFNVSLSNLSPSGAGVDITDEASGTITDNDNTAPVITQGDSPLSVTMSEDGSPTSFVAPTIDATDANAGDTLTWSLLSGGEASNGTATVSGTGATPTITYTPTGNFNGSDSFTVQVTDAYGATDNIVVNVTVEQVNDPGNFTGDLSETGFENSDLTGTLTFVDALDGATNPGYTVSSIPGNGTASIDTNGAWTYTPTSGFTGEDSFTISASDDDGNTETQIVTLTVQEAITITIGDETVVEGDNITFTATLDREVPGGFTVDVNFTDDTATGGNVDYAGTETLLTDNFSTGNVQGSSRITTANADSGSWHAFNSGSLWEIDTSGETLTNPGTGEGTGNTDERVNEGLVAQVLTVDSLDPNLNLITVSFDYEIGSGSTVYFHSHLLKEDGTPTNNQLFNTGVANGNIQSQWKNNGYLSANLSGDNGAQNGAAGTAVASFTNSTGSTITDSYSMTFDISDYIAENASTGGSLEIDSISDVDFLMFGFANNIVNRDGTGAVSISNFNISASPTASATLTFAGTAGETQTFTVSTNDDSLVELTESFNVSLSNLSPSGAGVVITDEAVGTITDNDNTAPVITQGDSPLSVTMSEDGSPTSFVAPTIDATDANAGDTLTWSLLSGGEASNGTATVSGTGATPTITYTATGNFNGSDSFTVQVTDAYGATDNIVVNVTVEQVNDTGTFTGDVSGSGTEDSDLTGILTFADAIDGATNPGYIVSSVPGNGTASIDSNGAWTYTPTGDFNGTDSFTVSATDDDGNLESQVVSVTVSQVNDPGTFTGDTSGTGTEDKPVSGTLTFTDSADGSATPGYTVSVDPAKGVAAIDSNGAWTYTPNGGFIGTDTFTVSATDDAGNIETQLVTVTIEAAPVVTETGESDNISLVYKFLETHRLFGENGTLTVEIRANGPNGALIDRFALSGNYGQQVVEYELARNVVPNNGYGFVISWEAGSEDRNREDSYEQLALTLDGSTVVTLLDILSNDIYTAMISQLSKDNAIV